MRVIFSNGTESNLLRRLLQRALYKDDTGRYVLVITEEIGQDQANDLTRIGLVHAGVPEDEVVKELVLDAKIFHEHGLAGVYALAEGVNCVMWQKDRRYAWT